MIPLYIYISKTVVFFGVRISSSISRIVNYNHVDSLV